MGRMDQQEERIYPVSRAETTPCSGTKSFSMAGIAPNPSSRQGHDGLGPLQHPQLEVEKQKSPKVSQNNTRSFTEAFPESLLRDILLLCCPCKVLNGSKGDTTPLLSTYQILLVSEVFWSLMLHGRSIS